jgi:nitroreductase
MNKLMLQANSSIDATVELTDLLRDRWSPRSFDPSHEVGKDDLLSLLTAAQWAPSAGNSQPWSFVVARRGDETHDLLLPHLSRGNIPWVPAASAIILAVAQEGSGPEADAPDHSSYASYDVGQAVAHLSLQARSLGLETRQFAGFDHAGVAEALHVPSHFRILVGIAIGRHLPTDHDFVGSLHTARPRVRKDLSEFVFNHTWGNPWA